MKKSMLVTSLALLLFSGASVADDFLGPQGVAFRGDPLTAFAGWEFAIDPGQLPAPQGWNFILPDVGEGYVGWTHGETLYTGFGGTHADAGAASEWQWQLTDAGGSDDGVLIPTPTQGAASLIAFNVANWVDRMPLKNIVVQITYWGDVAPAVVYVTGQELAGTPGEYEVNGFHNPIMPPFRWDGNHIAEFWLVEPNPDWEQIVVGVPVGTQLDEVVIDTISLPEPATLMLLTLGAAAVLQRRRR